MTEDTKEEKLSRLERELKSLRTSFPEHCSGTTGYVGVHAASPAHWQKIEDLEEEIKALKAELSR
jgi:hypothetical protein